MVPNWKGRLWHPWWLACTAQWSDIWKCEVTLQTSWNTGISSVLTCSKLKKDRNGVVMPGNKAADITIRMYTLYVIGNSNNTRSKCFAPSVWMRAKFITRDGHTLNYTPNFVMNLAGSWFTNKRFMPIHIPQPSYILPCGYRKSMWFMVGSGWEARVIASMVCIHCIHSVEPVHISAVRLKKMQAISAMPFIPHSLPSIPLKCLCKWALCKSEVQDANSQLLCGFTLPHGAYWQKPFK